MKKISMLVVLLFCVLLFSGCFLDSLFGSGEGGGSSTSSKTTSVSVTFNTGESREYKVTKDGTIVDFIAKSGTRLTGIETEDGVKIADDDGIMRISSQLSNKDSIKARATYADAITTFTAKVLWEESPQSIDVYHTGTNLWYLEWSDENDAGFMSTIKCNPYASLTISIFVDVKESASTSVVNNSFIFGLKLGDDTIANGTTDLKRNTQYATHTVSGTVKAMQFSNANFKVTRVVSAKYANTKYLVKNLRMEFSLDCSD